MGVVQSIFCSITFCVERVLTWTCCAFLLMLLMFILVILMIYGISVGYHYAQKELASFAMSSRSTTEPSMSEFGGPPGGRRMGPDTRPIVRLVAVNRTEVEHAPQPLLEVYRTSKPKEHIYIDAPQTPIVLLETERPPKQPELSQQEKELAKKLIGRFRRSRNTTEVPYLRPLNTKTGAYQSEMQFLRPLSVKNGTDPSEVTALRSLSVKSGMHQSEVPILLPLSAKSGMDQSKVPILRPLSVKIGMDQSEVPILRPLSVKSGMNQSEVPFLRPLSAKNGTILSRFSAT